MTALSKWTIHFNVAAQKQFEELDRLVQKLIQKFLKERLLKSLHPRDIGKLLAGNFSEFWRYRVGEYRIICKIEDKEVIILMVSMAHRREVYE